MAYIDTSRLQKKADALRQPRFGGSYASGLANAIVGLKANKLDKKIETAEEQNKANRERETQALIQAVMGMGIPQNLPGSGMANADLSQMQFTDPSVRDMAAQVAMAKALKEPKTGTISPLIAMGSDGSQRTIFRDSSRLGFFDSNNQPFDASGYDIYNIPSIQGGRDDVIPTPADTDLKSSFAGLKMFNDTAGQIRSIVEQNPNATTSWASLEAIGNSALANVRAVADRVVPGQDLGVLDPSKYRSILGEKSEELAAFYTAAAFQMGSAFKQEGRSLTEADMRRFLKMVGAGTDDPQTAMAILMNAQETVNGQWQYNFESFNQGKPYDNRYGELNYGQGATQTAVPSPEELTVEQVNNMTSQEALEYLQRLESGN